MPFAAQQFGVTQSSLLPLTLPLLATARRDATTVAPSDYSRHAPVGTLAGSLPPPATFAAPIASSIGLTPATAAIPGSGPRPAAAAAAAATLVTPTHTENA